MVGRGPEEGAAWEWKAWSSNASRQSSANRAHGPSGATTMRGPTPPAVHLVVAKVARSLMWSEWWCVRHTAETVVRSKLAWRARWVTPLPQSTRIQPPAPITATPEPALSASGLGVPVPRKITSVMERSLAGLSGRAGAGLDARSSDAKCLRTPDFPRTRIAGGCWVAWAPPRSLDCSAPPSGPFGVARPSSRPPRPRLRCRPPKAQRPQQPSPCLQLAQPVRRSPRRRA